MSQPVGSGGLRGTLQDSSGFSKQGQRTRVTRHSPSVCVRAMWAPASQARARRDQPWHPVHRASALPLQPEERPDSRVRASPPGPGRTPIRIPHGPAPSPTLQWPSPRWPSPLPSLTLPSADPRPTPVRKGTRVPGCRGSGRPRASLSCGSRDPVRCGARRRREKTSFCAKRSLWLCCWSL